MSAVSAAIWSWINFGGNFGRSLDHRLDPDAKPSGDMGVAIFSPGRDEAEHLPEILPKLCEQDHPRTRVVFIDDASTDATPAITAALNKQYDNLLVVRNENAPPSGWMGKCWAIWQGVGALREYEANGEQSQAKGRVTDDASGSALPADGAHADWFCFTDADIHWDPRLLSSTLALAEKHDADLIGLAPRLEFGTPMEAIVQLQLVLALGLMIPFEKAMEPQTPYALTGGAFILARRSFYEKIGGHEAVKGEMVEDLKLGQAIKHAGAKHRVALADELLTCRMYMGWNDMWEGLTKNAYAGVEHAWWRAVLLGVAAWVVNVLPPVFTLAGFAMLMVEPSRVNLGVFVCATAAWVLAARALGTACRTMNLPQWYRWTMPLGTATYVLILFASMWRYYHGGNVWKGRSYGPAS